MGTIITEKRNMFGINSVSSAKLLSVIWTLFLLAQSAFAVATNDSSLNADQNHIELINSSMKTGVSPCTDFVEYACGELYRYSQVHHVAALSNLEYIDKRATVELSKAVKQLQSTNDYTFLSNIHSFYESCKNEKDAKDSLRYLKWMNVNTDVKWPMAEDIKSTLPGMDWVELLAVTRKYGFNNIFLYEDIIPLPEDSSKFTIELKRPPLVPISSNLNIVHTNVLSQGEKEKFARFQRQLLEATIKLIQVEGEQNIKANIDMPSSTDSSPISLRDLGLPWINKYIEVLLEQSPVDLDMIVYVQNKEYLKGLGEFLSQYDNRFLSDYIQFNFMTYLNQPYKYYTDDKCTKLLRDMLPLPMQWIYKSQHPELQKELPHIKSIFENLKATFKKSLTRNFYSFPSDIVKYLQTKSDSMELSVDAITAEALEELYGSLRLSSTDYFGNRLKLLRHYFQITHGFPSKRLTRNSVQILMLRPAPIIDTIDYSGGYYNLPYLFPRHNLIFLPLTLLQDTYYEPGLSDVYSYSTIGFLLAHQIVKAFDFRYLRVDAEGHYNSAANETIQLNHKFEDIARKLRKELMIFEGKSSEALADIGGLKLAYDTILDLHPNAWLANVTLQGEPVNMDKVFFMSFAHNYCRPSCRNIYFRRDYQMCERVTVATEHSDTFSHAFNCSNLQIQSLWP